MQGWLHEPATLECFRRIEQSTRASGEEILIAQLYLQQHGASFSTNLLETTIEHLSGIKGSQPVLLEHADEFRHEAFLPWLVSIVDDGRTEESGDAQWVLEAITFRRDIQGRAAWRKWATLHIAEGRRAWKDRAVTELEALAKTNPPAAKQFMDKAMYRWKDPILLQDMERLADHKSLHNEILGWINLTYEYHQKRLQPRFRALALRILKDSERDLEDWARRLTLDWDFLHKDETSWEDHIRSSNLRV
jgi:hypothetical protein